MASINKTENLGLNLWAETDRPQRADFNSDNMIIDEVIGTHTSDNEKHLTQKEKQRVTSPVVCAGYVGNGEASRVITLPCDALAVVVYCDGMSQCSFDSRWDANRIYWGVAAFGGGGTKGLSYAGTKLTVTQDTEGTEGAMCCLNEDSKQYRILIFR